MKAINDKKNEVKSLVNDGKLDKAKAAKEELKELQEKFDLLFDLDEEEHEEIEDKVATGTAKTIGAKADKKNLVKAFVNIVKCGFLKREWVSQTVRCILRKSQRRQVNNGSR